jgi:hypothetical protein
VDVSAFSARRPVSLRRRLDNVGLRVQGRLDGAWADRVVPWTAAAALFLLLAAMALAVVRQLDGGPGLGLWVQSGWRLQKGQGAATTLTGADPALEQWAFLAYPLLWASRWVPAPGLFAVVQAVALSLAVVPIWRLARDAAGLRTGTSVALVIAYALAPAVHAANLTALHPEVLAVPGLAWATLFARKERWWAYWACVAVVLLARADLGLAVAGLGFLGLTDGKRRAGIVTAVIGVAWTAAAVVIVQPELPERALTATQAFAAESSAPLAVVRTLFTDPGQVFADLVSQPSVTVVAAVFAPLLFLPLMAPRYLLPAIPPLVLGIAADQAVARVADPVGAVAQAGASQVVVAVVPVFFAAVVALRRIGRRSVTRINVDHRVIGALLLAAVVLFVQYAPSSPYQQPWQWGSRDELDGSRQAAIDAIGDRAGVTVSPQLTAMVAERAVVRELPAGPPDDTRPWDPPTTDGVVIDTTAEDADGEDLWDGDDRRVLLMSLTTQGYRIRYDGNGIVALTR